MTAQAPDYLTIDGRTITADELIPLRRHPRIVRVRRKKAAASLGDFNTTSCWRNYVAHWRFEENRLFLDKLRGEYALHGDAPLLATWVSGILILPLENVSTYNPISAGPPYPPRIRVDFHEGVALSVEQMDWLEGPDRQRR